MKVRSIHWDENAGVCTKHNLPQTPCPQCLATADEDVEFTLEDADAMAMEFGDVKCVDDLLPEGFSAKTHVVNPAWF